MYKRKTNKVGTWTWCAAEGDMFWSRGTFRILGYRMRATSASLENLFEVIDPGQRALVEKTFRGAVKAGRDFDQEFSIVRPDGSRRHVHCFACVARRKTGVTEYVGAISDVTERWAAEEVIRGTHAELARVSRALTMGALVGSIAHEVCQPLAALVTNANAGMRFLNGRRPQVDRARNSLEGICRDGMRASAIITRIRALTTKGTRREHQSVNINSIVREIAALTRGQLRASRVTLRLRLPERLPCVRGDFVQLQQVLLNLIINGVEAMTEVEDRARELVVSTRPHGTDFVVVSVRDAGIGFEKNDRERSFEPFYTTKPRGMGIGLFLSKTIVEEHGGRLWARRNRTHGATLLFTLPVSGRA